MKERIPSFDIFIESYDFKQVCDVQQKGKIKPSCDIIFNANNDDLFDLTTIKIKDIKSPRGLSYAFYKRKGLNEDIAIVNRIIGAYKNNEYVPPLVIDTDDTIMDGLHRYVAAKEYFGKNGKIKVFKKI